MKCTKCNGCGHWEGGTCFSCRGVGVKAIAARGNISFAGFIYKVGDILPYITTDGRKGKIKVKVFTHAALFNSPGKAVVIDDGAYNIDRIYAVGVDVPTGKEANHYLYRSINLSESKPLKFR